jgi:hypothetical protein
MTTTPSTTNSASSHKTLQLSASPYCFPDGSDQQQHNAASLTPPPAFTAATTTTSPIGGGGAIVRSNLFSSLSFPSSQPVVSAAAVAAAVSSSANINNSCTLFTAWADKRETAPASSSASSAGFALSTASCPLSSRNTTISSSFGFPPILLMGAAAASADNQQQQQPLEAVVTHTSPFINATASAAEARPSLLSISTSQNTNAMMKSAFGFSFVSNNNNAATATATSTMDQPQDSVLVKDASSSSQFNVFSLTSATPPTTARLFSPSSLPTSPFATTGATPSTFSTASANDTTAAAPIHSAPVCTRIVQENHDNKHDDEDVREDAPSDTTTMTTSMKTTTTASRNLMATAANARMVLNDDGSTSANDIAVVGLAKAGSTGKSTTGPPSKSWPSEQNEERHFVSVTPTATTMAIPNESNRELPQLPVVCVVLPGDEPRHVSLNVVSVAVVALEMIEEPVVGDKTTNDKSLFKAVVHGDEDDTAVVAATKLAKQQQHEEEHNVINSKGVGPDMTANDKNNDATTMVLASPNIQDAAAADVDHENTPVRIIHIGDVDDDDDGDETLVAPQEMQNAANACTKEEEIDAAPTTTTTKQGRTSVPENASTTTTSTDNSVAATFLLGPNPSPSDSSRTTKNETASTSSLDMSGFVFGSGTTAPTFAFATSSSSSLSGGGFSTLTSARSNNSVFAAAAPSSASSFNIFGTPAVSSSLSGVSSMAKPLFGNVQASAAMTPLVEMTKQHDTFQKGEASQDTLVEKGKKNTSTYSSIDGVSANAVPGIQAPLQGTTTTTTTTYDKESSVNDEKNSKRVAMMEANVSSPDTASLKSETSASICPTTTKNTSEVPADKSDLAERSPASCEQQPVVDSIPEPKVGCATMLISPHDASTEVATQALTEESTELSISDDYCQQRLARSSKDGSVASTDESLPLEPVVVSETPPKESSTGAASTLTETQCNEGTSKVIESTVSKPAFVFGSTPAFVFGTQPVFRFGIHSKNPPPKVDFLPQKIKGPSFGQSQTSMARGPMSGAKFEVGVNRTDAKSPSLKTPYKFGASSSGSIIPCSAKAGSMYEFGLNRTDPASPNLKSPFKLVASGARSSLEEEHEHKACEMNTLLPPCLEYDALGLRIAAGSEPLVPKMAAPSAEMFPGAVRLKNATAPKSQSIFMPIMETNRAVFGLSYIERLAKDHLVVPLCSVLVREEDCESSVHDLISQLRSAPPSNSTSSSSLGRLDPQRKLDERSVRSREQHEIQLL